MAASASCSSTCPESDVSFDIDLAEEGDRDWGEGVLRGAGSRGPFGSGVFVLGGVSAGEESLGDAISREPAGLRSYGEEKDCDRRR